jgi:drug/metabolite transporter (DMT)-like permease
MPSSAYLRWGGLCFLVGGLGNALFFLLHVGGGDPPTAQAAGESLYGLEHTIGVIAFLLTALGLIAVALRLGEKRPRLTLIGFLLAFIGTVLLLGSIFADAYVAPLIAAQAPRALASGGALASGLSGARVLPGFLDGLGFLLLGVTILLQGGRARWAGDVLLLGAVLFALPFTPWGITVLGAVILGLGQAWVGYTLWANQDLPTVPRWVKERLAARLKKRAPVP